MVGRPRKAGKRKPCGRLAQTYENPRAQVAMQPHRVVVPVKFREWPEAATAFGRLMIAGTITPAQHEAGARYAQAYNAYQRAMGSPPHNPSAMNYEPRIAGRGEGLPDATAAKSRRDWTAAFNAMENIGWQQAVMHHAVHDRDVTTFRDRFFLQCGLNRLVEHFGIDSELQISSRA